MRVPSILALLACATTTFAACGGGHSVAQGNAGGDAAGGAGGMDASSDAMPEGASGGMAGKAGAGGSQGGGDGGPGGTSNGGTGGTQTGGSGGQSGSGGSNPDCPGGCNDLIDCTIDSCVKNACQHALGACPAGQICDPVSGCKTGPVCSGDQTCLQLWASDACKTNVHCDGVTATCTFTTLDKDGDGHAPVVCGGDDCDDSSSAVHPGGSEVCNGKDDDCNNAVDDGQLCSGLLTCQSGSCQCPPAYQCGNDCPDKSVDMNHCGACNNACPTTGYCSGGTCHCNGSLSVCGSDCVDTQTNASHCGGCFHPCASGASCQSGICTCPAGAPTTCNGMCVNTNIDNNNCGSCSHACMYGNCSGGVCPTCVPGGLLIMLDQSGSTSTAMGSTTRLQAEIDAVVAFVQEAASSGLSVGLRIFPTNTTSCLSTDYTPSVAIAPLPANSTALVTATSGLVATTNSVISAALQGSIDAVHAWELGDSTRKGAVVMMNDGGIGIGCTSETTAQASGIASAAYNGTPSVRTYVIGVGSTDSADTTMWSSVAAAGGGTVTNAQSEATILNALRQIRTVYLCP